MINFASEDMFLKNMPIFNNIIVVQSNYLNYYGYEIQFKRHKD